LVNYGVEDDGPVPFPELEVEEISVPPTINPLSEEQHRLVVQRINLSCNSADSWGVDLFLQTVDFFNTLMQ
jgi:hypothetical protein